MLNGFNASLEEKLKMAEQAEQEVHEEVEEAARQALESAKHSIPNPAEQQLGVFAGVS